MDYKNKKRGGVIGLSSLTKSAEGIGMLGILILILLLVSFKIFSGDASGAEQTIYMGLIILIALIVFKNWMKHR